LEKTDAEVRQLVEGLQTAAADDSADKEDVPF